MAGAKEPEEQDKDAEVGVGKVIDPTKNVLDLVKAESKYQDGMRDALKEFQDAMRSAMGDLANLRHQSEVRYQDGMRDAESKRVDQLANQSRIYDARIAEMLRASVESTSNLVSTQLVQIQNTFNERVAKLEQFRYESVGKAGVADPALAQALSSLSTGMGTIQTTMAEAMAKMAASISGITTAGAGSEGRKEGAAGLGNWILAAIGGLVGVGLLAIALVEAFK
jgi:TolA-binding protein